MDTAKVASVEHLKIFEMIKKAEETKLEIVKEVNSLDARRNELIAEAMRLEGEVRALQNAIK